MLPPPPPGTSSTTASVASEDRRPVILVCAGRRARRNGEVKKVYIYILVYQNDGLEYSMYSIVNKSEEMSEIVGLKRFCLVFEKDVLDAGPSFQLCRFVPLGTLHGKG